MYKIRLLSENCHWIEILRSWKWITVWFQTGIYFSDKNLIYFIFRNCGLAFRLAEDELGVPALLDIEDLVDMHIPDR